MVIVTGANGFVGQNLAPQILRHFKSSEVLFLAGSGNNALERRGINALKKLQARFLEVNLVTGRNIKKIPKSPRLVIHMASQTDTSKADHRTNSVGTRNFLKAIAPLTPDTHLIYTSTAVMYSGRRNCSLLITNKEKPSPTNNYGRSKLEAEEALVECAKKFNCRLTILRIGTIYGKDPREYKMFKVLKKHILKQTIIARLNWPGKTSIIHIDDVISAILHFVKNPALKKIEIQLLSAESPTLSQVCKIMHKAMRVEYRPINLPNPFWQFASFLRTFMPLLEKITSPPVYNLFWRFSLIIDNVIDIKNNKMTAKKTRKFADAVEDVI